MRTGANFERRRYGCSDRHSDADMLHSHYNETEAGPSFYAAQKRMNGIAAARGLILNACQFDWMLEAGALSEMSQANHIGD